MSFILSVDKDIVFVADRRQTTEIVFTRIGGRKIDMSLYPSVKAGLTRTVKFVCDVQKTTGATSVSVQLYDVTNDVLVTSTGLVHSADTNLTEKTTSGLTVGSSAGNVRSDAPTMYEVQAKRIGGTTGIDAVYVPNARLVISYA